MTLERAINQEELTANFKEKNAREPNVLDLVEDARGIMQMYYGGSWYSTGGTKEGLKEAIIAQVNSNSSLLDDWQKGA